MGGRQTAFERGCAFIVGTVGAGGGGTDPAKGVVGKGSRAGAPQEQSFIALHDGPLAGTGMWCWQQTCAGVADGAACASSPRAHDDMPITLAPPGTGSATHTRSTRR
jgi:hypothetical protein